MKVSEPAKPNLDGVLRVYDESHINPANRLLQWICIPLLSFGLLGVIWSIPFPHLGFLGKYNGFVNWASFSIAFTMYYYYRISPLLSYGILLMVFVFAAGIVTLEKLHLNAGWPGMGAVCMGIFILGLCVQFLGFKSEGRMPALSAALSYLLNGPLWLMYRLFRKIGIIRS